jgi:hypothetical protein
MAKMANEQQANAARQKFGRDLMKKGVHAIGVEEGIEHGKKGWVVVAHVAPKTKVELPSALSYSTDEGAVEVPLVTLRSEPFKLE